MRRWRARRQRELGLDQAGAYSARQPGAAREPVPGWVPREGGSASSSLSAWAARGFVRVSPVCHGLCGQEGDDIYRMQIAPRKFVSLALLLLPPSPASRILSKPSLKSSGLQISPWNGQLCIFCIW